MRLLLVCHQKFVIVEIQDKCLHEGEDMIDINTALECARWHTLSVKPSGQRSKAFYKEKVREMKAFLNNAAQANEINSINQIFKVFEKAPENVNYSEFMGVVHNLSEEDAVIFFNENKISITIWMNTLSMDEWKSKFLVESLVRSLSKHHSKLTYSFEKLLSATFPDLVSIWKRKIDDAQFEEEYSPLIDRMKQAVTSETHTEKSSAPGFIVHHTMNIDPSKLKEAITDYFDDEIEDITD